MSPVDQAMADEHVRACDTCRTLREVAEGRISILPQEIGRELTRAILQRTSGSACPRVEACLCDFVDGDLDEVSSQLVELHLDSCVSCRSLADGLAALKEALPDFAELDPGHDFTRMVVAETSGWKPYRPDWRTRFLAWWTRMVQRPRFSFEAAYLGTLVLVLTFANPILPLGNVALEKIGTSSILPSAREAVSKVLPSDWVNTQAPPLRLAHGFAASASQKGKATLTSLDTLLTRGGQLSASSVNWQVRTVAAWFRQAKSVLFSLWSRISRR